jgi:large subunit ribosomal protein L14e
MVFRKFVEIGRVVMINYGPLAGKLAVIVDILNTSKVLVHGPKEGVRRQEISLRRITLTEFKLDIKRGILKDDLVKAIESAKIDEKFKETAYGKKLARRLTRAKLTDFDRFKVMRLKQKKAGLRGKILKPKKK